MVVFLPFLLLLLAIALVLRIDLYFTIVWFLLGLYALARLWTQRAAQYLQITRAFVDHAFTGDRVTVTLTVRNAGRLPMPWLQISESVPIELRGAPIPTQVVSLAGRSEREFRYTLVCRQRGYHQLGPWRAETGDVLGIEERVVIVEEPRRLTVYPRVVALERLGLSTRSALATLHSKSALFEDTSRVMGVRDYQPGDSPRRIHWTATARIGRLVVKQYQPAVDRETLICLDMNPRSYPAQWHLSIEQAIVVAASLAHHMVMREGLSVGLSTEARDPLVEGQRCITLPPRFGRAQLMSILEVLARIQVASTRQFTDLLREESADLAWGSTIVVITGRIDDDLAATALYLKRSGHAVVMILVRQAHPWAHEGHGEVAGIPVYRVWTDRDLVSVQ
jgi:uncharacterized protein (DUF58 family)